MELRLVSGTEVDEWNYDWMEEEADSKHGD